jgi:pyruvate,water dikinase
MSSRSVGQYVAIHGDKLTSAAKMSPFFGGKMASLVMLAHRTEPAFRIPPGIGISTETVDLVKVPDEMRRLVRSTFLPVLLQCRDEHGGRAKFARLAVRSSANIEDGAEAGFPGVFESVTDVPIEVDAIVDAIKAVRESATTERVGTYCESKGIDRSSIRMACILQWQVESLFSGVAMTSTNNRVRDQYLLLNFARGHCRHVVDGESSNEIVFTKDAPVVAVWADCREFKSLLWAGGTSANEQLVESGFISLDKLIEVARLCSEIENTPGFERPMDVEWTVDFDGDIHVLQARPIIHAVAVAEMAGM